MSKQPVSLSQAPDGYGEWLAELKSRINSARQRAALFMKGIDVSYYYEGYSKFKTDEG